VTKVRTFVAAALVGAWAAFGPGLPVAAGTSEVAAGVAAGVALAQSDLDAFMHQVLAKRDENWKKLQQYVLDEHERIDMMGPALVPMMGQRRDYRWFVKKAISCGARSPSMASPVPDSERRKSEDDFLRKARERDQKAEARAMAPGPGADGLQAPPVEVSSPSPAGMDSLITQTGTPQFVDSAYFLKFKFEQGKYALVGREQFDGRDVLKIEYYPARLFSDAEDGTRKPPPDGKPAPDRRQDREIERLMNKNSLVTLWVEPGAKQIVKYSFDNIQTDFLPIAWLFRLEDIKASMTMSQAFKDVWLPRDVDMLLKAMFAIGTIDLHYHLDYVDYKEATTSGRIRRGGRQ
jgi:hypothetical protein